MRLQTLLPFAASLLWTASALAGADTSLIPVLNYGFEAQVLNCTPGSQCFSYNAPAWALPLGNAGTFRPSTIQYPDGVPQGVNIGFLDTGGVMVQRLAAVVERYKVYTLRLRLGHRQDAAFNGYLAALTAGNTIVAFDSTSRPSPGTFVEDMIVYRSGPTPPQLGQNLSILLKNPTSGQVDVDDVSVTVREE